MGASIPRTISIPSVVLMKLRHATDTDRQTDRRTYRHRNRAITSVGFVAAAVSMPMGGCRAIRPVVDVSVAAELAVL